MIRVLVSANSAVELAGLTSLIKSAPALQLVGSVLGGADLTKQIETAHPDVVLQQASERTWEGPAGAEPGVDFDAPATVLLLDESQFAEALRAVGEAHSHVRALLPRWATAEEITAAVLSATTGLLVLHPAVLEAAGSAVTSFKPDSHDPSAPLLQALSAREAEILNMLADGLGNKEIAWRLHISEHTVKFHIGSIFNKLNASSRTEAVAIGIRRGLIAL